MDGSVSPGGDGRPVRPSEWIDEVCDRFELNWRAGRMPRIEDYLAEAGDADRPSLLRELVALEIELRRRRGERPETQEYLDRFAGAAAMVAAAFQETTITFQGRADVPAPGASNEDTESDGTAAKHRLPEVLRAAAVYRPQRYHARGGLGEVLAAHQEELDRTVALKRIRPDQLDEAARRRFLREAAITAQLQHPGIVPIYGLGQDDDGPFYTMPFIAGQTLHEAIEAFHGDEALQRDPGRRAIGFRGLLQQFIVVCDTMAYAHDQGVIHRDLKPSNIMLGPYGETLVLDWGLARRLGADDFSTDGDRDAPSPSPWADDLTATGDVLGTPQFMSPEQARGEPATPASDIFCLGLILYAILTGRRPYQGRTLGEVLDKVRRCEFRPPRQVTPGLSRAAGGDLPQGDGGAARGAVSDGAGDGGGRPALAGRRAGGGLARAARPACLALASEAPHDRRGFRVGTARRHGRPGDHLPKPAACGAGRASPGPAMVDQSHDG